MLRQATWICGGLDQDWVDSANGFWSVLLFSVCSVAAFFIRYATEPITCFSPAHFTEEHVSYAHKACFMQEEFYIPYKDKIPVRDNSRGPDKVFSYHLWIPMILFFQALCFKIPNIIWTLGKRYLTINLDDTVETLKQAQTANPETRRSTFQNMAKLFTRSFEGNKFLLALLYLFVKLLFCLNLVGQLIYLGINFRKRLFDVYSFNNTRFLKVVLCAFDIRILQRIHDYTVQCSLPINEIYEKLFVFLWYWLLILAVVTILNLLLWIGFLFLPFLRDRRIKTYIKGSCEYSQDSAIARFVSGFLGIDGVLVLSKISNNSCEMVAAHLTQQLYQGFLEKGDVVRPVASASAKETSAMSEPDDTVRTNPEGNAEKPTLA